MLAFLLSVFLACSSEKPACSEEQACPLGSTCVEGECVAQACATSDQCPIEQYCSSERSCVTGCQEDGDCRFGDTCDVGAATCVTRTCSDAHQDCALGEFCSPAGECYEAQGYYCAPCEDDGDCGGNGNRCVGLGGDSYCGVTCRTDADCPGGFSCSGVTDNAGNVIAYQCITACWVYLEGR